MSDGTKKTPNVARRDTLKLVTAVTALGAGLGIIAGTKDAKASDVRVRLANLGNLSIKLIKLDSAGNHTLLDTIDVSVLARAGAYSIKLYNEKNDATTLLGAQSLDVVG